MTDPANTPTAELTEAWQLLMGLVLDQRMRWAEVSAELGISQSGLRALLAIDPEAPPSQRELATAMNCDPSYITGIVDDLEKAGYAARRTGSTDRRIKVVVLTEQGIQALQTAQEGLLSPPRQLAQLPAKDQRALARLLQRATNSTTAS